MFKSWKPVVRVAGEGDKWHKNGLAFATIEEAKASSRDLSNRWLMVTAHSAEPHEGEPTHTYKDGVLKEIKNGH